MPYLIGTDEAGYGPNLGPLVVAASAWRVPEGTSAPALYELLEHIIRPNLASDDDPWLPMADSKVLYKSGGGLAPLERSVLCALAATGKSPRRWRELWGTVVDRGLFPAAFDTLPWHADFDLDLPSDTTRELVAASLDRFEAGLASKGVSVVGLHASAVFPREFNEMVARTDSKGEALSLTTLQLVKIILETLPPEPVVVTCDKHGGRNRYAALLNHVFPDALLSARQEGRDESHYILREGDRRVDIQFFAKGERFLPTALASMLAKYLRELAMRPFNDFWLRQIPGLRPTAGYPEDARRFHGEIADAQKRLSIPDDMLWRCR